MVFFFSFTLGLLWLSTVPLTSGLCFSMFGDAYAPTLFGIAFASHQLGSFFGAWLGGLVFDQTGSYDLMWWLGVLAGGAAALLHWPIESARVVIILKEVAALPQPAVPLSKLTAALSLPPKKGLDDPPPQRTLHFIIHVNVLGKLRPGLNDKALRLMRMCSKRSVA